MRCEAASEALCQSVESTVPFYGPLESYTTVYQVAIRL